MCGIVGFVGGIAGLSRSPERVAQEMATAIRSRGPDDAGVWLDLEAQVVLGHRRLSVVDLSEAGHQPMPSPSGRLIIVFNGEIYNHLALRKELRVDTWHGHSDTETLVTALEQWGLEETLGRLVGMFAFAVWDRSTGELSIARDRMGEKPLYYGQYGRTVAFASELKALRRHPHFIDRIDSGALALYLQHSAVPSPHSIVQGTRKLPPGSFMTLRSGSTVLQPRQYWDARQVARSGTANPLQLGDAEAVECIDRELNRAVRSQLMSDVPLGVFLSGGIDSSLVLALAQENAAHPLNSFTIGFGERSHNETFYAREVAEHLGSVHHELVVGPQDAAELIPRIPLVYDEPFGDSSAVPTLLVSQLARQSVTVALTGDGADELFGGYNRHVWGGPARRAARFLPRPVRVGLAGAVRRLNGDALDRSFALLQRRLPKRLSFPNFAYKLNRLLPALVEESPLGYYSALALHWRDAASVVRGVSGPPGQLLPALIKDARLEENMMLMDLSSYLPDDILVKSDRAAMSVSLEARAPFLDHRVAEIAWQLPISQRIRGSEGKWVLRRVLERHLPERLVNRPKMGFGLPMGSWLREDLRDWAESLLAKDRLEREGLLAPEPIRRKWEAHVRGIGRNENELWDVLMFQAWYENWRVKG